MRRRSQLALVLVLLAGVGWLVLGPDEDDPLSIGNEREPLPGSERTSAGAHLAGRGTEPEAVAVVPPEQGGACTIRGFVRNEDGELLPGIPVGLTAPPDSSRRTLAERYAFVDGRADPVVATATTAADGSFVFEGAAFGRTYGLVARPPPPLYAGRQWAYTIPAYQSGPPVIVVHEGVPLKLRVVDGDDRGVRAFVSGEHQSSTPGVRRVKRIWWERHLGATDADGRLAVAAVPPGRLQISVAVPGFGQRAGRVVEVRGGEEEVVVCVEDPEGAALAGRVHDADGRAVAGARLYLEVRGSGLQPDGYAARAVTSAADGTFRIGSLMPGRVEEFVVDAPGYVVRRDALPSVFLSSGRVTRVDVLLERGGAIEGTVRGPDDVPVANAWVEARSVPRVDKGSGVTTTWEALGATRTDARGHFRLDGVKPMRGLLRASAPGLYPVGDDGTYGARSFSLSSGRETLELDLRMKACAVLEGIVVDGAGDPVAGAHVAAEGPSFLEVEGDDRPPPATNADGRFVLGNLVPGHAWSVTAFTEAGRTESIEVEIAEDAAPAALRLLWHRGAAISGRVIFEPRPSDVPARVQCARRHHYSRAIRIAADGSFRFEGLEAGTYELVVVDYNLDEEPETVVVEVAGDAIVDDVVLHARPMGEISGLVTDEAGEPQVGISVGIRSAAASKHETTRRDGRFFFSCVPDVPYTVFIDREEQPGQVRVRQVDLRYVRPARQEARLEGRVLGPDGAPVARAELLVMQWTNGQWRFKSFPVLAGRFLAVFRSLGSRADLEVVSARDEDGANIGARPFLRENVDVTIGEIVIRLETGLAITGRVEGPPPGSLSTTELELGIVDERGEYDRREVQADADGHFTFVGLAPGRYALSATRVPAGWVAPSSAEIQAGAQHVVLTLPAARTVTGSVVGPDGAPVVNARVDFAWIWPNGEHQGCMTRTRAGGAFEVRRIPDGVTGRVSVRPLASEVPLLGAERDEVEAGASGLVFELALGALIEGSVTDEEGRPVGGATIVARPTPSETGSRAGAPYTIYVPPRATGFAVGPLPPGGYELEVQSHPDFDPGPPRAIEAPAKDVEIVLRRR